MNLTELIEQLELIKQDHPEAAQYPVYDQSSGLEAFAVYLASEELRGITDHFVKIEFYRPWGLSNT